MSAGSTRLLPPALLVLFGLSLALASACLQLSPFETDLDPHERQLTEKQLARIAALPQPVGPWRFAVITDSHNEFDNLASLVKVLNARDDLAFVAHLGDISSLGLRSEFHEAVVRLQDLRIPFITVLGNHDTLSNGLEIYREMFGPLDYTFTYGGIRFVCVNSNRLEFPDQKVPDLTWLSEVTVPSPNLDGVVTLSHQSLALPGRVHVLVQNGVVAALRGHAHRFEIESVQGVLAVTSDSVTHNSWLLVSVDGSNVTVSNCHRSGCTPQEPP